MLPDDAMMSMVMADGRALRPNSIELRRSYPSEQVDSVFSPHGHDLQNPPDMIYRFVFNILLLYSLFSIYSRFCCPDHTKYCPYYLSKSKIFNFIKR